MFSQKDALVGYKAALGLAHLMSGVAGAADHHSVGTTSPQMLSRGITPRAGLQISDRRPPAYTTMCFGLSAALDLKASICHISCRSKRP